MFLDFHTYEMKSDFRFLELKALNDISAPI